MDDELKRYVEKRFLQEKLAISEKRLQYFIAFFGLLAAILVAVFGIIIPINMTNANEERTNRAILNMESKFAQLVGDQLKKPQIEACLENEKIENGSLKSIKYTESFDMSIGIKNIGDGTAKNLKVLVYFSQDSVYEINTLNLHTVDLKDEGGFKSCVQKEIIMLYPKEMDNFKINIYKRINEKFDSERILHFLLKVYYGQPEPYKVSFVLNITQSES